MSCCPLCPTRDRRSIPAARSLPLIEPLVNQTTGLQSHSTRVLVAGAPAVNSSYPEQRLTLHGSAAELGALLDGFTLGFDGAWTPLLPPVCTSWEMRDALMALDTVGAPSHHRLIT